MPLLSIIFYENKLKKGDYHEIYKTNILGEVVINYKPSDVVVAKEGY